MIKKFKIFENINPIDPYGEENWDDEALEVEIREKYDEIPRDEKTVWFDGKDGYLYNGDDADYCIESSLDDFAAHIRINLSRVQKDWLMLTLKRGR